MERDKDILASIRYINGMTENGFSFENRDAQLPAVAPQKHNGSIRELLVSAKDVTRVLKQRHRNIEFGGGHCSTDIWGFA